MADEDTTCFERNHAISSSEGDRAVSQDAHRCADRSPETASEEPRTPRGNSEKARNELKTVAKRRQSALKLLFFAHRCTMSCANRGVRERARGGVFWTWNKGAVFAAICGQTCYKSLPREDI